MYGRHYSRKYPFARFFLNADTGGGDGGEGNTTPAANAEPKTLAEAKKQIATLSEKAQAAEAAEARALAAEKERDEAKAEVGTLTGQFNAATEEATRAKTELATAQTQIGTLTGERDQAKQELAKAGVNVSRLEKLCGVKGVDPNAAVPPVAGGEQVSEADKEKALAEAVKNAKTPTERAIAYAAWSSYKPGQN